MIPQAVQEKAANGAAGVAVSVGLSAKLVDINIYLETATLVLGALAGIFALGFQIRRYYRFRHRKSVDE